MSSVKEEEAQACIREAEKYLKTTLLKWKPDFDGAANEYQRAATCYKTLKNVDKCIEYHLKAADCFKQNRQYYSAAKSYEQVAMLFGKDMDQWDKAIDYFQRACGMYREHGVPDTAAMCLDRGAKMIEPKVPEKAAEFYAVAADTVMIEGKAYQAAEFAAKSARVNMKLKRLDEAAKMTGSQLAHLMQAEDNAQSGRVVVCLIIIHLARDDYVAAKKAFVDGRHLLEQQELCSMSILLDAWDSTDSKKVISSLNHPFIKSLDNEITKLVRDLQNKHGAQLSAKPTDGYNDDEDNQPEGDADAAALL